MPTRVETAAAWTDAGAAAEALGVEVRTLDQIDQFRAVEQLFGAVWGRQQHPPMNVETMRALQKSGNYVAGVFRAGSLVGAAAGFFEPPAVRALHSHIGAVIGGEAGRGVGRALKLHQRAWALDHDLERIIWTYDPLVRRNGYFNLVKLGGRPTEYLPDFYGLVTDAINGSDQTDRLLLEWELLAPGVAAAAAGRVSAVSAAAQLAAGAVVALGITPGGAPEPREHAPAGRRLVAVPADIERLRLTDRPLALAWRQAQRAALQPVLAAGGRITGFDRDGWYLVTTDHPDPEPAGHPTARKPR